MVRDFGKKLNFVITAEIRLDWDMKTRISVLLSPSRYIAMQCNAMQKFTERCSHNFKDLLNEYSNLTLGFFQCNPFVRENDMRLPKFMPHL